MAAWTLKFDSAGPFEFLHWRRRPAAPKAPRAPDGPAARREVGERRAEAMRGLFPKISAWMARQSYLAEMHEVERYLSQSKDLVDLECRIRDIERRGGTPRLY